MVGRQPGRDRRSDGPDSVHAQLLDSLEAGVVAQLVPLLLVCVQAEKAALSSRLQGEAPLHDGPEDLANLNIIAGQIIAYERRWRSHFHRALVSWPDPPRVEMHDAFSLVSDAELQAQLIGQPVVEALEHRHVDVLDTIDSRLWSLAAMMGGKVRPANPFSPQHLVDSFLHAFTPADCGLRLRGALLRHFERRAGERLVEVYAWCNRQLSDAGHALPGAGDYATLAATMVSARPGEPALGWDAAERRAPEAGSQAAGSAAAAPVATDAVRGNALRHRLRLLREARAPEHTAVRSMKPEEFLAVLSLLQGEPAFAVDPATGYPRTIRSGLERVAGSIGIDRATAVPSAAQEDAIELVGRLFDQLAARHQLSPAAQESLARLALPCLQRALADPALFEADPQPAAMRLLSLLVELWDANARSGEHETALHDLADQAANELVAADHGDGRAAAQVLARLEAALEPLQRRAAVSERRAWQTAEGRERLEAARQQADRELASRLQARSLLPAVAAFLDEYWRQSLVQAWLRSGPESERYAAALALGDGLVQLDTLAAQAQGAQVAAGLLELQQALLDCYGAFGMGPAEAAAQVATLVTGLARPDAPRRQHDFTPLAPALAEGGPSGAGSTLEPLPPGTGLVRMTPGEPPLRLRLAWRSPLTGAVLLVAPQGTRELLLPASELTRMLADGHLLPRPVEGPVEAALRHIEAVLAGPAAG